MALAFRHTAANTQSTARVPAPNNVNPILTDAKRRALRNTLVYFVLCSAYILISSSITFSFDTGPEMHRVIEISKGLGFAVVTSVILYVILRKLLGNSAQSLVTLRHVIDSIHDVVLVIQWDTREILDCNPAVERVFGYAPAELIGKTTEILHVGTGEFMLFGETATAVLERQGLYLQEYVMRRRNGEIFASQHSIGLFHGDDGRPIVVALIRDISQQKQMEEELRVTQRLKAIGQMAAGVAHDFNNHLTVIVSNLSLMADAPGIDNKARARTETSLQAARRAAQLAASLSSSARKEAKSPTVIDLAEAAERTLAFVERAFAARINVTKSITSESVPVLIDQGQLEDAVLNLAINARDAMPEGGTLSIEVYTLHLSGPRQGISGTIAAGKYGVLKVSDTGIGITPENLPKITEPFFTTKDPGKGTGLGLSMIHEFVRESGGHMRIDSQPGAGTKVELYFPLVQK